MISSLYNTLLTLGIVLSSPYFALKFLTASHYRKGLSQRLGICYKNAGEKAGNERPLWIHA
ncbi:MAG: 3-deoxy-D-manno-octulosonic acid transferase, partial [Thermodesulfobacteriota bacterium]